MNIKNYRKLTFDAFYDPQNDHVKDTSVKKGYFHRWADDYVITDDGRFSITVGIVEDTQGNVFRVPIGKIIFEPLFTAEEQLQRLKDSFKNED
jgi:hypothetical protein